jgi:hypothetical protein
MYFLSPNASLFGGADPFALVSMVTNVVNLATGNIAWALVSQAMGQVMTITKMGIEEARQDALRKARRGGIATPWFSVPSDYKTDKCSRWIPDHDVSPEQRAIMFKNHISQYFVNLTKSVYDTWDLLVTPTSLDEDLLDSYNMTDVESINLDKLFTDDRLIEMGSMLDDFQWSNAWNDMLKKMSIVLEYVSLGVSTQFYINKATATISERLKTILSVPPYAATGVQSNAGLTLLTPRIGVATMT